MNRLKRIFGFLMMYKPYSIKLSTKVPGYSKYKTYDRNWNYVYGDIQEETPNNMPKAKERKVTITMFVDANHFHDRITGRSVPRLTMVLTMGLVDWFSKHQASAESTYRSEFVATRIGTDKIIEMWYMLRMLGVLIKGVN